MKTIKIIPTLLCCILISLIGCTKKETIKPAGSVDLSSARIGALSGSTGEMFIKTSYENANLTEYDSLQDAVTALKEGQVDYVITSYVNATSFAKHNPELIVKPGYVLPEGIAIAVSKSKTQLLSDVSRVLTRLKVDGTLADISKRWIPTTNTPYEQIEIPVYQHGKTLRVAVSPVMEPIIFMSDDKIIGLDAEIIERIAYELKMVVEYVPVPFDVLVTALDSDLADVAISNLTATEERKQLVNFTEDYFSNPKVLMRRK